MTQPIEFPDSPLRDRMVFLVGARRSGTNWLFRLLTTHPNVVGITTETYLFALGLAPLRERFHHGASGVGKTATVYLDREDMLRSFRELADRAFAAATDRPSAAAQRIVEHTPAHAQHLNLIGAVYPDAWVIHIIRDGRDAVASLTRQAFGPDSVAAAAHEWSDSIRRARQHAPPRYREVRYETLLADPLGCMRELFEWLAVPWTDGLEPAIREEARAPYNVHSSNPAIAEGKWRSALTSQDAAAFDAVAGDLLRELGYPPLAPARAGVRQLAASARQRGRTAIRRVKRRNKPTSSVDEYWHQLLDVANTVAASISASSVDDIAPLLTSDARVRIGGGHYPVRRGTAGVEQLAKEFTKTRDRRHRQVRGDVYTNPTGFTLVQSYLDAAGNPSSCVVVARVDANADPPIRALNYHQLPASGVPDSAR